MVGGTAEEGVNGTVRGGREASGGAAGVNWGGSAGEAAREGAGGWLTCGVWRGST